MHHTETVNQTTYAALADKQRHLIVKTDPLMQPGDPLMIRQPDSREELEFVIQSTSTDNINQKGGLTLLGLYAPYKTGPFLGEQKIDDHVRDLTEMDLQHPTTGTIV